MFGIMLVSMMRLWSSLCSLRVLMMVRALFRLRFMVRLLTLVGGVRLSCVLSVVIMLILCFIFSGRGLCWVECCCVLWFNVLSMMVGSYRCPYP